MVRLWWLCVLLWVAAGDKIIRVDPSSSSNINPGQVAGSFALTTLNGTFSYTPANDNSQDAIIFLTYSSLSGFDEAMWGNPLYIKNLFWRSPTDCQYVFLSIDSNAVAVATQLHTQFQDAMNALKLSPLEQGKLSQ